MKKSFAVSILMIFFVILLIFWGVFIYFVWGEEGINSKAIPLFMMLLGVAIVSLSPHFFIADEKGLTVYYIFFLKDYYDWEDIKRIEVIIRYRSTYYSFETKEHVKKAFFMTSEFHKDFMLKRLIKKYWHGEVEGDDWENLKKKIRARKDKHNTFVPDDSEAEKAEREARKQIREIINNNKLKAEASNRFIRAIYTYETKSGEYKSRPKESYGYNVEIEIGQFGVSEDERLYIITELLFVRYSKKCVKVIPDENAFDEIAQKINEAIEK